jgi:uncharacterized protein (DUF1501 family)
MTRATVCKDWASPLLHSMRALAAMSSHSAAAATDYRAIVCVYLQGGNDGHGTLIATETDSFAAFTQARSGAEGLAYPMSQLLPIAPVTPQSGRSFALNPTSRGYRTSLTLDAVHLSPILER